MISLDKKYRTRDGREVRLFMDDSGYGGCPILGAYKDKSGCWISGYWGRNGRVNFHGPDDRDLVEIKPRIQREVWINLYRDMYGGGVYFSKETADNRAATNRIACVKLTIDCEEGEGL